MPLKVRKSPFSSVCSYRFYHLKHHLSFGSDDDTDRVRYEELGIADLDRSDPLKFIVGMIRLMPRYLLDWYWSVGTNINTLKNAICWHFFVWIIPAWVLLGSVSGAIIFWGVYVAIPIFVFLPPLRFLAESAEHTYEKETVFTASNSNQGFWHQFLHPHNDGYHALHHLFAAIPHWQLKRAHLWFLRNDQDGFATEHRFRVWVFEDPKTQEQRSLR